MNKDSIKKITSMRLFLPIVCLVAVLLVNLITTPGFFKISINNGVLYGYIVDVVNRASELVILAVGMTLVTAASGGQVSVLVQLGLLQQLSADRSFPVVKYLLLSWLLRWGWQLLQLFWLLHSAVPLMVSL